MQQQQAASSAEASLEINMTMSNDSGPGHCHLTSAKDQDALCDWGASPWRGVAKAWPTWRELGAEGGEGAAARGLGRHRRIEGHT